MHIRNNREIRIHCPTLFQLIANRVTASLSSRSKSMARVEEIQPMDTIVAISYFVIYFILLMSSSQLRGWMFPASASFVWMLAPRPSIAFVASSCMILLLLWNS